MNESSKTIWKYELKFTDNQEIEMPCSADDILTVQMRNARPCLWAIVDPEAKKQTIMIKTIRTGNPLDDLILILERYLGTYQTGGLVYHVFTCTYNK